MVAEEIALVQAPAINNRLQPPQPQLAFPANASFGGSTSPQRRSSSNVDYRVPKASRALTDHSPQPLDYMHHQPNEFRQSIFSEDYRRSSNRGSIHNSNSGSRASSTFSDGGSDEDDDDEDENEVEGLVNVDCKNDDHNAGNVSKNTSKFGWKEGYVVEGTSGNKGSSNLRNAVTIAESGGGSYYTQSSRRAEGSNVGHKDMVLENVGFSGRKEGSHVTDSMESLRTILSDPVTGGLMDDAMILRCGHSFGSGGLEHVLRTKVCYTCSHGVSEDSAAPNLLLRAAVKAFRREEELHASRASKRRRERYDQEKGCYGDSAPSENSRRRGVQFPFALTDRVIIKGNKRTPPRFVGREAIVVNQCLNGWYVVKTVDNSEQVKLQYRSLAKVLDDQSSKPTS